MLRPLPFLFLQGGEGRVRVRVEEACRRCGGMSPRSSGMSNLHFLPPELFRLVAEDYISKMNW